MQSAAPAFRHLVGIGDFLRAKEAPKLLDRSSDSVGGLIVLGSVRFHVDRVYVEALGLAIHCGVDAAYKAVAMQDGKHVVAVLALLFGHVDFDVEIKIEE